MLKISRRTTIKTLAAALWGSQVIVAAARAQGSGTTGSGTRRLVGAIEEDPPIINPAITSLISSFVSGTPVYSALTRMDVDGNISGDLAERWTISPDGLVYTFYLRKNITWHDGAPFSANDVKFSLEQINSKLHPYRGAYRAIETVDASLTDNLVVLKLKQPQGSLLSAIHNISGCILPKHLWEGTEVPKNPLNKKPVGTGAFKFAEYIVGDRIRYVKNESYFIPGQPAFDEIVLRIMPDAAARVAAFEKGDLDMLYSSAVPAPEVPRISKMPGVTMKPASISAGAYLGTINTRSAPYSDVRVRRALAHAIDRAYIRDNVLPGMAKVMIGPVPPSSPLSNKALADYAFDPARANALLDEAGFARNADGHRFDFRLLWSASDLRVTKMGDIIAQNLAAVGIRTVLQPLERAAVNQRGYIKSEFDMVIDSFAQGPDPDIAVERLYNSNNIRPTIFVNNSAYANPVVDKLFDEQRVQTEFARRKAVYDRIQELVWADLPILPLAAYSVPAAIRTTYATNVFDLEASNREDFSRATPVIAPAATASSPQAAPERTGVITAAVAGGTVAAAAAVWLWRRRTAARSDEV